MDLTDAERAELLAIRERALALASHPYTRDARPAGGTKVFKAWARKLDALGEAWAALDTDTQTHFLVAVAKQWTDSAGTSVPDLNLIARNLREGLALPQHAEEDHPGLIAATRMLWRVWITDQPGVIPIDRAAVAAIAACLAPAFELPEADARRRVEHILREWDKGKKVKDENGQHLRIADMPGRGAMNVLDSTGKGTSDRPFS